jgi:predicted ester cyclase
MTAPGLVARYRDYIARLNGRDWDGLRDFVADGVVYNGESVGFDSYRDMLVKNYEDIPDLQFEIGMVFADRRVVASRLLFDCTPRGAFMGLRVNGRRVTFSENVFYRFDDIRICEVWSIVDKAAIERQL